MTTQHLTATAIVAVLAACGCSTADPEQMPTIQERLATYATVPLEADLSVLSENQQQMIPLLKDAAQVMNELFWIQAYGDKLTLLSGIDVPDTRRYVEINYGPWDRLGDNEPFLPEVGPKPLGANFYPTDMTKEEFDAAAAAAEDGGEALRSLYTLVRRDADGNLVAQPYHQAFALVLQMAASKLREAAELAEDEGFRHYLELRADALLDDNYQPSDLAWLDMKTNTLDVVIGPIETYEDQLYGYKASYEAYILIKDKEWSNRLERFAALLPELQRELPVPDEYKQEQPGTDSDLNAYDVIYYAGDSNAGAKTIAINLPNDEEVQLQKGTRRLQLKNAMRAKFDRIMLPIADLLIAEDQRPHVTFDAFFENTMFHEVAHGLGIKNTLTGDLTVREALRDHASAIEEGKADILGLYLVTALHEKGELTDTDLMDNYVTFLAGIFRSIRFGASSAHGVANLLRFNYFEQEGAFSRDSNGAYRVSMDRMQAAVEGLSEKIILLQGDGDYDGVAEFIAEMGSIDDELQGDLDRVANAGIPVDVVWEQD